MMLNKLTVTESRGRITVEVYGEKFIKVYDASEEGVGPCLDFEHGVDLFMQALGYEGFFDDL